MTKSSTNITLLNKQERFYFHLADVMIVIIIYTIITSIIVAVFDMKELNVMSKVLFAPIYFLYFLLTEYFLGTSFIKRNFAQVVDEFGNKPSLGRVFIRTCCRLIPIDALSFLVMKRGKGLHDVLSGTQVVTEYKKD